MTRPPAAGRVDAALAVPAGLLAAAAAHQLGLLAAAATLGRRRHAAPGAAIRFAILIPAHDEAATIGPTLAAMEPLGAERIVVADNCTDATAAVAAGAGATVWERHDPERRGKGHALRWGLERLLRERAGVEAVVVIDADCRPSANLLDAVGAAIRAGAAAVQVDYVVADADSSPAAALRAAAFALMNHVRPRGRTALGLSAGLLGTGMAFRADLLRRVPWRSYGLAEDAEHHLRLVEAGERVAFVPEASVRSPMPATLAASESQQMRWEGGRLRLARRGAALVARGLARRDPVAVQAGLDPLLPPQSVLGAGSAALAAAGAGLRLRRTAVLGSASLAMQAAYVLGGLALTRAPAAAWLALLRAPLLVAFKLRVYARALRGGSPDEWVRTER
ncbi:MAG TPA: glycosyltransferase [Thermoleophilaceae bacterium]|jgi:hypothetical protein